jgi:LAO/AO transport system kinase
MHPADSPWTPPVLTCSAALNTGVDAIWSQVLKHRARFQPTGRFEQRRRAQMVQWMWDLVNEHVQRVLHDGPEVRIERGGCCGAALESTNNYRGLIRNRS